MQQAMKRTHTHIYIGFAREYFLWLKKFLAENVQTLQFLSIK